MPKLDTKKRILALDPATKCGWAFSVDLYGTWNLKTRSDESWGMKLLRFESKLKETFLLQKPDLVVYERPGGRNTRAIITQSKLIGIIERLCSENLIDYRAYSSTEIKKYITGKGNANKEVVIKAVADRIGYTGKDDNEADALALLLLADSEINF